MKLQEIDYAEFYEMSELSDVYTKNYVLHSASDDNVIAFMEFTDNAVKYYKVVRE